MGLEHRPYVGTWRLGALKVVQHTPDALVYLNGDTTLPGCSSCSGRVNFQKYITELSVDAGTDPGSASASFTLSVPVHSADSFARDAEFLLRPGMEVHAYVRGYYPVKGMFQALAQPVASPIPLTEEELQIQMEGDQTGYLSRMGLKEDSTTAGYKAQLRSLWAEYGKEMREEFPTERLIGIAQAAARETGVPVEWIWGTLWQESGRYPNQPPAPTGTSEFGSTKENDTGLGVGQINRTRWNGIKREESRYAKKSGGQDRIWWKHSDMVNPKYAIWAMAYEFQRLSRERGGADKVTYAEAGAWWMGSLKKVGSEHAQSRALLMEAVKAEALQDVTGALQTGDTEAPVEGNLTSDLDFSDPSWRKPTPEGVVGESLLESVGLQDSGIEDLLSYPYYHVFHGVVTQVSHSWSPGSNTISVSCSSMLHFWSYHNMNTQGSIFGARPTNSKLKTSLVGNNFTGMHPYEIMYTLHHDTAGAAGGVAWAIAQKSNQTAVSEVAGESLFSLNLQYWQKRFSTRMTRLRMHGATGALFSAAQATYLSRLSSAALSKAVRDRFADPSSRKNPQKKIFSSSQNLSLTKKDKLRGLQENGEARVPEDGATFEDLVFAERSSEKGIEIVLPEMVAFVSNISEWGQVALFESTYESKLDVAQKVMEVTGFEFYQDVDGDFVFKPPMFNLDTSDSRIYRIEDIDIISIDFREQEPQVTYMTVKGSHWKNLHVGIDNEWGVQGQYIDYRLVAQFGWRPQSFETSYFNDPRSMFFAAVNRMDILNAPINAASVTIPLRPELRPGYPVYIPFLDVFYYCNSFTHSYSVGGRCTTSLELIAKRAKFYPPGDPREKGINAIQLGNTLLPERPLETLGLDGTPRLEGFPNVVMALDPDQINPMFFVVGTDSEQVDDPHFLGNLVKQALDLQIIRAVGTVQGDPEAAVYVMDVVVGVDANGDPIQGEKQFVFHRVGVNIPDKQINKKKGDFIDLQNTADAYTKAQKSQIKKQEGDSRKASVILDKIDLLRSKRRDLDLSRESDRAYDLKLQEQILVEERRYKEAAAIQNKQNQGLIDSFGQNPEYQILTELVDRIGKHMLAKHRAYTDLNSTINLLDMLSDKKATFSNGTQPGSYRYYSASHPNPAEQGQPLLEYDNVGGSGSQALKGKPSLDRPVTVRGFLPQNRVHAPFPGAKIPEALLGDIEAVNGIRVLTSDPRFPGGVIKPTNQIRELMFAVQKSRLRKTSTGSRGASGANVLGTQALKYLQKTFIPDLTPDPSSTLRLLFGGPWDLKVAKVTEALQAARARAYVLESVRQPPVMEVPSFPASLKLRGITVASEVKYSDIVLPSNLAGKTTPSSLFFLAGSALGESFYRQLKASVLSYQKLLASSGYTRESVDKIMDTLGDGLTALVGVPASTKGRRKYQRGTALKSDIYSPVFPVSDAKGYRVIGSYRYGRDIAIDPDGIWDSLHRQDPLSFMSNKMVSDFVTVMVEGGALTVEQETLDSQGRKKVVSSRLTKESSVRYLERQMLQELRKSLSDQDIIDLFKLKVNERGEPDQLAVGMMNYIADQRDGVAKLPIANAAFALSDLNAHLSLGVCECKAAEAGVLLASLGREEFVALSPTQDLHEGQDSLTQFLLTEATVGGEAWKQNQDALRGRIMNRAGSSLKETFKGVVEQFRDVNTQQRIALDRLANSADDL